MPFRPYTPDEVWSYSDRTLTQDVTFTFERIADVSVASGGAWTPSIAGFYRWIGSAAYFDGQYYSDADTSWITGGNVAKDFAVGDGVNYRIVNNDSTGHTLVVLAIHYTKPKFKLKDPISIDKFKGEDIIVLEKDVEGRWYITVEVETFTKYLPQIKADIKDVMGYGKYKDGLRKLGFDV